MLRPWELTDATCGYRALRVEPLRRSPQPPARGGRERRRQPCLGLWGADVLAQHSLLLVAVIVVHSFYVLTVRPRAAAISRASVALR